MSDQTDKEKIITDLFVLKVGLTAVYDQIMGENAEKFKQFVDARLVVDTPPIGVIRSFLAGSPANAQIGNVRKDFRKRNEAMTRWRRSNIARYGKHQGSKGFDFYEAMQSRFVEMVEQGMVSQMTSLSDKAKPEAEISKALIADERCISSYENFYIADYEMFNYDKYVYQHYLENLDILRNHLLDNKEAIGLLLYSHPDIKVGSPKMNVKPYIDAFIDAERVKTQKLIELMVLSEDAMKKYHELVDKYSYLLHESDFESLDYIIYLFVSKRSDTMKEALHLLDNEKRANRIVECIFGATNYLVNNLRSIIMEFGSRLETAIAALSANVSALSGKIGLGLESVSEKLSIGSQELAGAIRKVKIKPSKMVKLGKEEIRHLGKEEMKQLGALQMGTLNNE